MTWPMPILSTTPARDRERDAGSLATARAATSASSSEPPSETAVSTPRAVGSRSTGREPRMSGGPRPPEPKNWAM